MHGEITLENRLTLSEAGRKVGEKTKPVAPSTIYRWIDQGLHGVKLAHIRLGRRIYTSAPALERFGREVAEARESAVAA